jgi:DNA primase
MNTGGRKSGRGMSGDGQTELFAVREAKPESKPSPILPHSSPPTVAEGREDAFEALLAHCMPVRAGSREASWLKERRVFRKTWLAQGLRVVADYRSAANGLLARFAPGDLAAWGLFNREGHLRFYRHTLLVPWSDGRRVRHLQAFATQDAADAAAKPAVLSTAGTPPAPYNAALLDGAAGRLYLCAGVPRTLEMLEAGFPAVGTDEDGILRAAWTARFKGKSVYVAFGEDAEHEAAAARAITLLADAGIEAHRLRSPDGIRT